MRTRRSWRNQNRLWRELGGPEAPKPFELPPPLSDAEIDAMFWIPKQSRRMMKLDAAKRRGSSGQHSPKD